MSLVPKKVVKLVDTLMGPFIEAHRANGKAQLKLVHIVGSDYVTSDAPKLVG